MLDELIEKLREFRNFSRDYEDFQRFSVHRLASMGFTDDDVLRIVTASHPRVGQHPGKVAG